MFFENLFPGLTDSRAENLFNSILPVTPAEWNKRIGVAVAFGPITIFYFWFERESMGKATRICTSTLIFMAK